MFRELRPLWVEHPPGAPTSTPTRFPTAIEGLRHRRRPRPRVGPHPTALPHVGGGWEWAGRWLGSRARLDGDRGGRDARAAQAPREWFLELRRGLGMQIIPLGPGAGSRVGRASRRGDIMCLLCDRDLSGTGIEVEFFGGAPRCPAGRPRWRCARTRRCCCRPQVYFRAAAAAAWSAPRSTLRRQGRLRRRRRPGHWTSRSPWRT